MISVSLPENYYVYLLLLKNYVKCVYLQYHNVPYKAPLTYMSYKHIFSYSTCTKTKEWILLQTKVIAELT